MVAVLWPTPASSLINPKCFQGYYTSILVDLIVKQWHHKFVKSIYNLHTYSSFSDYTDWVSMLVENPIIPHTFTHLTHRDYPWWHTWTLIIICQQLCSVWIPYDLLNTCLHLASSAPLPFPVPVFGAPVSSPCLTVSHPSSLSSDALSPTAKAKRKCHWHRCRLLPHYVPPLQTAGFAHEITKGKKTK